MKKTGYIKATRKLEIEEQSELLISAGCSKIYVETSKEFQAKEKLHNAIESLCEGDTLSVTRLSILCISVQSLLEILFKLEEKNITLEVVQQKFISKDTHTLNEVLFYLNEFIEDIRVEKQTLGLDNAKADNTRLGRPPKLTSAMIVQAIKLKHKHTSRQVANRFGVGRSTLLRHIAKEKQGA